MVFLKPRTNPLSPVVSFQETASNKPIVPSETAITYTDPTGFSFNYPDNLTLAKNDQIDANTYADIQLTAKGVNGSLSLKIVDSKFKSLDDWLKANQTVAKNSTEVKLGNLKAQEVKISDRLLLGALDQGILFTIEMPLIEEQFWMKVYNKILADFTFTPPDNAGAGGSSVSSGDVSFEGEEVVE